MGLDPLQSVIATTALALPEARTLALAGGGAMIAHGYTERSTHDIDLFTEDLAADKVLALWARARPRDYHDVAALIERFGYDRLFELAAEKDSGFTAETFVDALTAIRRLSDADWTEDGIEPGSAAALKPIFEQWNSDLRNASS